MALTEAQRAWRARNPDKVKANFKRWYEANRAEVLEKARARKRTGKYDLASRAWKLRNPQKVKLGAMRRRLQDVYGIGLEDFWWMYTQQGGKCKICRNTCSRGRSLSVDHCHTTGKVRGLLCGKCNLILGKMKDSPKLIQAMLDYLVGSVTP